MDSKIRNDLSYNLWGKPIFHSENKFTMNLNPKYGRGEMIGLGFGIGINTSLANYSFDFALYKPIKQYKEDVFFIGKVLKGQYVIREKDDNALLFNEGDIFCFLGNYLLDTKYNFSMETVILGVFGYKEEIVQTFIEKSWYSDKIENILNDSDLKKGIILSKTNEIEQLMSNLHTAIECDDKFTTFIKVVNIFDYFITNYDKNNYTKRKTYTERQIDTVIEIKKFLDDNLDTYYSMPKIADMFNISLSRMQSIFTEYYKMSPYRYHLNVRLERAHDLILNTDIKINSIAKSLGFSSYNNFFKAYREKYSCNPSKHRMS